MKIIDFRTISQLNIKPEVCVKWVEESFALQHQATLPAKVCLHLPYNAFFTTMPCHIPAIHRFGTKVVYRYPGHIPSLKSEILLYDDLEGKLLSLLDGTWITAMRTGAVACRSINLLRNSQAKKYAFIGLGNTARATLLCLLNSNRNEHFHIYLQAYKEQEVSFIKRFETFPNVSFSVVHSTRELLTDADVIVSSVTAADDLFGEDHWFKKGVLLVPIHTRGFQNCDLFFDKVFADARNHVSQFKYFNRFKYFDEISNVISGIHPGRTNDQERILVYNIGISLHDIYFASKIFEMAVSSNDVELFDSTEKFWI